MNHDTNEERDELWALLGKARTAKSPKAFTRDVLRRLRMEESSPEPSFVEWMQGGWNLLRLAGAVAAVAVVVFATHPGAPGRRHVASGENAAIDEVVHSEDFSVIANLDLLMAMDENDLWLQASAR